MTERYNGWKNYETWATNLWLTNDQATYRIVRGICLRDPDEYKGTEFLKGFVEGQVEKIFDTFDVYSRSGVTYTIYGLIRDIFRANLSLVDWLEIWRAFRE